MLSDHQIRLRHIKVHFPDRKLCDTFILSIKFDLIKLKIIFMYIIHVTWKCIQIVLYVFFSHLFLKLIYSIIQNIQIRFLDLNTCTIDIHCMTTCFLLLELKIHMQLVIFSFPIESTINKSDVILRQWKVLWKLIGGNSNKTIWFAVEFQSVERFFVENPNFRRRFRHDITGLSSIP